MRLKGHGHAQQEAQMLKLALVVLAYRIFGHVLRRLARQQEKLKLALVVLAYRIFGHVLRRLARHQEKLKLALVVLAYRIFGHVLRRLARQQEKGMRPNLQLRVAKCAGEERHVEIPVSNGMTSVTWDAAAPAMVE